MSHFDTIVAPITGSARAAVAIVRLSGEDAWAIARRLFPALPPDAEPLRLYYGTFLHGDDGYLTLFASDRSYTAEPAVECSIHGSPVSVRALVEAAIGAGARMAEPGEFTQRAFLNGRIDLTQAEAVRDTIEAQTEAQLRMANWLREGELFRRLSELREELISLLTAVEASVDFSEEIGGLDRGLALTRLRQVAKGLAPLLESATFGRLLREGMRVALVGRPNAGKSSLLNKLLASERAIVSPVPGTTRDFVEESIDLDGLPVVLIDTAGLREVDDEVEAEGVRRSRLQMANADLALYLFDSSVGWTEADEAELEGLSIPYRVIATKIDLMKDASAVPGEHISTLTGAGIPALRQLVREFAGEMPEIVIAPRHQLPLGVAWQAVNEAMVTLRTDHPADLASVNLNEAIAALGEVTGETASPDVLHRIFHDFCIGK